MRLTHLTFLVLSALALGSCGGSGSDKLNEQQQAANSNESAKASDTQAEAAVTVAVTPENIAKGKETYERTCAACHGPNGKGDGPAAVALNPKPRDHTDGAYMDKLTDDHIFKTIKFGGQVFGKPMMPAQPNLSDEQIKEVIAFIRSLSSTYKH